MVSAAKRRERKKERRSIRQEAKEARRSKVSEAVRSAVVVFEASLSVGIEGNGDPAEIAVVLMREEDRIAMGVNTALGQDEEINKLRDPLRQVVEDTAHLRPTSSQLRQRILGDPTISSGDLLAAYERGRGFWKERR